MITCILATADALASTGLRRCIIYDDKVAYFSIVEPVITHVATENVDQTEGYDFWVRIY